MNTRLQEKYNKEITKNLRDKFKYKNNLEIPKLKKITPHAGIFFLADFRDHLKDKSFEAEEKLFHYFIKELGINMTPGRELGLSEPGYFRICYAKKSDELDEFIRRMNQFLNA